MLKIFVLIILSFLPLRACAIKTDSLNYSVFGKVTIYSPETQPKALVLFISGDGGWNKGVIEMAKVLLESRAMVVGIDIRHYLKGIKKQKTRCYYPAADFEDISLSIQKKYKFPTYLKPVLFGYSSGATLVYGILAQAPANTFKGGIALGFCPDIKIDRPLCRGEGLSSRTLKNGVSYYLESSEKVSAPFIVINGNLDQVCLYADVKKFMDGVSNARLIIISSVGHGFAATNRWAPQLKKVFQGLIDSPVLPIPQLPTQTIAQPIIPTLLPAGLPLTLIPALKNGHGVITILFSGDGGWTSFDQSLADQLARNGLSVIGFDTQKYFWNAKTPKQTALDVSKILNHYTQLWDQKTVVLMGYSFGACVAPFVANLLNPLQKEKVKAVVMLSPDVRADFEIHITNMLNMERETGAYDVLSAIKEISTLNPVCIFGSEEEKSLINQFQNAHIKVNILPGSHHYDNNFQLISENILKSIGR